ncbi:TetR family transcriptional regulator [Thermosporothrix hazakensis]|jgi:AcrR family transcriptional regulator|uniref:TetR family transcriptional regulator n=1 Tax=Thermosporothrix hazakensis TaxID=644383 RepID=A0A326UEI5_THEHA|nr:TetR family transcriptional regulator [Thermosporothrix hazakensis]PZW28445.1 TetR family transcriptional regulator [Thermosporothrix hazakensis]GCE45224.1 TetR family transcriptional regulator [Thermosporothrix hazakensis]
MSRIVNENDPRVQRTRQLLLQAFMDLVREKQNLHGISVQDITERARVNRSTFYAHFEDKYALVEDWLRGKFQRILAQKLPASSSLHADALATLLLSVFEFLALVRQHIRRSDQQFEPLFEQGIQQEIYELLLRWLTASAPGARKKERETTAQVISWAILGTAAQWSRGEQTISAQEMVRQVLPSVIAALSPLVIVPSR